MFSIILASTSPYRRILLQRLQIPFICQNPKVDESYLLGEPPDARALRLAEEKASILAADFENALIIGGDQTISDGINIFDKPETEANSKKQLMAMSGKTLFFYTAVSIHVGAKTDSILVTHEVMMRDLSVIEIENYIQKESALNCAGGVQIEGLGITLMQEINGGDPTALMGMPLIHLSALLRKNGISLP